MTGFAMDGADGSAVRNVGSESSPPWLARAVAGTSAAAGVEMVSGPHADSQTAAPGIARQSVIRERRDGIAGILWKAQRKGSELGTASIHPFTCDARAARAG